MCKNPVLIIYKDNKMSNKFVTGLQNKKSQLFKVQQQSKKNKKKRNIKESLTTCFINN